MYSTINDILKDDRTNKANTYIVHCAGYTDEIYTREERDKLQRLWGHDLASYYFLNTREILFNIQ